MLGDHRAAALRLGLLGLWTGALASFGIFSIPAAFSHLPTSVAADVLGGGFRGLEALGTVLGAAVVLLGIGALRRGPLSARVRVALPGLGGVCSALSFFWVTPTLRAVRARGGGALAGLPEGDRGWIDFEIFHQLSEALFVCAAAVALSSLLWDVWATKKT